MGQKAVIQSHHLIYSNDEHGQKEVTANIYKGEHMILLHLNRRTNISEGFIRSLDVWLALNRHKARTL